MKIKAFRRSIHTKLPIFSTLGSAGADLCSIDDVDVYPGMTEKIRTGLCVEIPEGYAGFVNSRSGLAAKHSVAVLNSPGVIDSDFRGEICVLLHNHGRDTFCVSRGDRIAQLVIVPYIQFEFEEAEELTSTSRGEGGFGSTGIKTK